MSFVVFDASAFLLNNGKAYPIAHAVGMSEWFFWSYFWPRTGSWYMQTGWIYFGTFYLSGDFPLPLHDPQGHDRLRSETDRTGVCFSWAHSALPILLAAQALRTLAMVHASSSFSHEVSRGKKADDHVLVTWGVYRSVKSPSSSTP